MEVNGCYLYYIIEASEKGTFSPFSTTRPVVHIVSMAKRIKALLNGKSIESVDLPQFWSALWDGHRSSTAASKVPLKNVQAILWKILEEGMEWHHQLEIWLGWHQWHLTL